MYIAIRRNNKTGLKQESKLSEVDSPLTSKISTKHGSKKAVLSLTDLPNEILGTIFALVSFDDLYTLERVNKRLRGVVVDVVWPMKQTFDHQAIIQHTAWPKISLYKIAYSGWDKTMKRHRITDRIVETVLSRTYLRHLDLSIYCSYLLSKEICSMLFMAPELISLDLSLIPLTANSLATIVNYCPMLEKLSLEACLRDCKIDGVLTVVFHQCQNLQYLNLSRNNLLNGSCFAHIPVTLKYLNIGKCSSLTTKAMTYLAERAVNLETLILNKYRGNINQWLPKLSKLKSLEISIFHSNQDDSFLNISDLKDLEMLCLKDNASVTVETLESLQFCFKLKSVDLSYNPQLDGGALDTLRGCPALKHCNLSAGSCMFGIAAFVKSTQLEYLDISYSYGIPEIDIKELVTECKSLSYLEIIINTEEYYKTLSSALSKKLPQRKNVLNLAVRAGSRALPSCKWCQVVTCTDSDPPPFSDFVCFQNLHYK